MTDENSQEQAESSATSQSGATAIPGLKALPKFDSGIGAVFVNFVLKFDRFIFTKIIYLIYYIGFLGVIVAAFGRAAMAYGFFGSLTAFLVTLIGGFLAWRLTCEMLILVFRSYDRLCEIRDELRKANGS